MTIMLGFLAGFCAGNGLPYYHFGSTGATHATPLGDSSAMNVLLGWAMFVVAAICWHFAHVPDHPLSGYTAAATGLLAVGVHHARGWRNNPWEKRSSRSGKEGGRVE